MKIIKDFRNNLLKRQEVSFSLEAEKNPGFDEMRKQVSEQVGKPEEVVNVYNIKGSFGSHEFKVDAYVYDSKDDLGKFVQKKKKDIGKKEVEVEEKPEEKVSKGGAPAEEKPEQVQEQPESKPTEAPVEERAEQEQKAVGEQRQAEEESKEP